MLPKSNIMTTLMEHLGIYHDGGEEYMFCNQDMLDATCSMLAPCCKTLTITATIPVIRLESCHTQLLVMKV